MDKDKDEHTEIIGGAEVTVRGNEAGLDTGDYSDVEVVAVLEDDTAAEEEAIAAGYRRRGVIWVGEQDLWAVLGLDITKAQLRHVEFDQRTMTWKIYLDSDLLPLVAPYTEARVIDYAAALELLGTEDLTAAGWRAVAVKLAIWCGEHGDAHFWRDLTTPETVALGLAVAEDPA